MAEINKPQDAKQPTSQALAGNAVNDSVNQRRTGTQADSGVRR